LRQDQRSWNLGLGSLQQEDDSLFLSPVMPRQPLVPFAPYKSAKHRHKARPAWQKKQKHGSAGVA
jgi:hypothetical protein